MLSEFDLIKQYFRRARSGHAGHAVLGIGDDCALLAPRPACRLAISTDLLIEGRHFFAGADPRMLGHKCLAVNLSDLAAMGAKPVGFTLALSLPGADPEWLEAFSSGMFALADQHDCELIGGDTTRGPLAICITVFGEIAPGHALRRDAARAGTTSGSRAPWATRAWRWPATGRKSRSMPEALAGRPRMHQPTPRIALGRALAVADGARGARHLGRAGWRPRAHPGSVESRRHAGCRRAAGRTGAGGQSLALRRRFTLAGGDDYELCFTAPAAQRDGVIAAAAAAARR
jgi:thiamine-monophosphate kinase